MNRFNSILCAILIVLMSSNGLHAQAQGVWVDQGTVHTPQGRYYIKGVCYHPVEKGATKRSFDRLDRDLELMKQAGINTIRVYEPIDSEEILDEIFKTGIRVIVSFGYNQQGVYDLISGTYLDYVKKYKNHPAILFWELGNEYNYHPEWFGGSLDLWYTTAAKAIKAIRKIDTNHPIASAHGEVPNPEALALLSDLDLWGLNIYRWDESYKAVSDYQKLSDKAVYFSELGADSYMTSSKLGYRAGANQKAQAHALHKMLSELLTSEIPTAGVTVFSFTDGWWKAGHPERQDVGGWAPGSSGVPYDGTANEEYWGLVDIDRNPKEAYHVVKSMFNAYQLSK